MQVNPHKPISKFLKLNTCRPEENEMTYRNCQKKNTANSEYFTQQSCPKLMKEK